MENNYFEQKVRRINWAKYLAPEYYNSETMYFDPARPVKALIQLSRFDGEETESGTCVSNDLLFAIGNDHRGTYYPAALEAIDLLIEIEKNSNNEKTRKCAKYFLNDLHYFQLEMSDIDEDLYNSINNSIREKLKPYSDENL